jgi:hypothetical protein
MRGKHALGEPPRQDWGVCTWQNLQFAAHSWHWRRGMPETVRGRLQDVTATRSASLADSLDQQAINLQSLYIASRKQIISELHCWECFVTKNTVFTLDHVFGQESLDNFGLHIGSCFWPRIFRQFWMQLIGIPVGVKYAPFLANFHILIIWDWVFWKASLVLILAQLFFVSYRYKVWRCYFYFLISFNSPMSCI